MDHETGCPDDYAELFGEYFPMMRSTVYRSGIADDDVEDVAMDILARFIEKDGIGYYDPHRVHDVGESPEVPGARYRKAKFKGMLRGFTATYVMQYRDKQISKQRREPWRLETPVTTTHKMSHQRVEISWGERNLFDDETIPDTEVAVSIIQALKATRATLQERSTKTRDYDRFLDLALQHGLMAGKIDRDEIRSELGISVSTMNSMVKELRTVLRPLLVEVGVVKEAS